MRTLIFHDGALGDALLSLPCILSIGRDAGPIDAVCRGDAGRLLLSAGIIQGAFSADSGLFSSWYAGQPDKAAREHMDRYQRVFVFTQHKGSTLVTGISGAVRETQVIITVPPAGNRTHVAQFRLGQLPEARRHDAPARLSAPPGVLLQAREVLARAGSDGKGLIVLHPGSGGAFKCWSLERYFTLAEQLAKRTGAFILFLSGPAEEPAVKASIDQFVRDLNRMAHAADRDITIVAGLLAQCSLFIGNDSGISHLAAAAGAPVIALFGPTDPALWRPYGERVLVIAAGTIAQISVDKVLAAAEDSVTPVVSAS